MVGKKMRETYRAFGEDFVPTNILNFRCKQGDNKGKTLFELDNLHALDFSYAVQDVDCFEIEDLIELLDKDSNFKLLSYLERYRLLETERCLVFKSSSTNMTSVFEKLLVNVSTILNVENLRKHHIQERSWKSVCFLAVNYGSKHEVDELLLESDFIAINDIYDLLNFIKFFSFSR